MKKRLLSFVEYLIVFISFSCMRFFSVPGSDCYFFSRDYENTLQSILHNSLFYGNGRLLGNIFGIGLTLNYKYTFLVIAFSAVLLIYAINKFFFNNDWRAVMPLSFAIILPYKYIFCSVFGEIATMENYLTPLILVFFVLCLLKYSSKSKFPALYSLFIFLFAAAACLFSENTTITIFVLSVLCAAYNYLINKKISFNNILFIAGSVIGGIAMFMIPHLTNTSDNLDSYRGVADGIVSIIKQSIVNISIFSNLFAGYYLPLTIITIGMIIALIKFSDVKRNIKVILISILATAPIEFVIYINYSDFSPYSTYMYSLQAVYVALYAFTLFISLILLRKSKFKTTSLLVFILTLFTIAPLLIVNICGNRTFYQTYILLISFSIYLIKEYYPLFRDKFPKKLFNKTVIPYITASLMVVFVGLNANLFIQSVYNFDYYVVRTNHIAEQIDNREEFIEVPPLPCRAICGEDESPSYIENILYKVKLEDGYNPIVKVVKYNGAYSDKYYDIMESNPISATIYAFQNRAYKNPMIIDTLINKN